MSTRYPNEPSNDLHTPTFKPAVHETLKDPIAGLYFTDNTIPVAKVLWTDTEPSPTDVAWGTISYVQVTADQTIVNSSTETALTSLTRTVTMSAGRRIRISAQGVLTRTVADGITIGRFKESTTELGRWGQHSPSATSEFGFSYGAVILTPTVGPHTYHLTLQRFSGTGNVTFSAAAVAPGWLLVEDIGPV